MIFSRYSAGILIRVIIILGITVFIAFILITKSWFFTPLVALSALLISVIELIQHLHKQQRELNNFLIAVKQGGFNTSFNEVGSFKSIFKTFNEIITSFRSLAIEKESNYQFLVLLTENIRAGIICYNDIGEVTMLNPTAKSFIGKPFLNNYSDLKLHLPEFYNQTTSLASGQTHVVKMKLGQVMQEILVHKKKMIIEDTTITILLLQNIQEQLDTNELDSWQKLTRVMRHEIMNSLTPIVGLSEAINSVLEQKKSLNSNDEEFQDIKESIDAIESRSKALLQFVNAYKDFSDTPDLHETNFDLTQTLMRVDQLFHKDFLEKKIKLKLPSAPYLMRGDEHLLEGVLINLIKNSIEAIEQNGKIQITVSRNEKTKISIADDGPGLTDEQLENIFVPFFTTKVEGSGIGLSLARKVVQIHKGRINAFVNDEGGLTIEIII